MSNAKSTTLYDVLGVKPDASKEEIQRAYRKAAMRTHPDRRGGNDAEFKEVQRAGEVLLDAKLREAYDASGDDPLNKPQESRESRIRAMFSDILAKGMVLGDKAFAEAWQLTAEEMRSLVTQITERRNKLELKLKTLEAGQQAITHKGGKHSTFLDDVVGMVKAALENQLVMIRDEESFLKQALEMIEEFSVPPSPFHTDYDSLEKRMAEAFRANQASTNRKSPFTNNFGSSYGPQR